MYFEVTWTIVLTADSFREAAELARGVQLAADSEATFFDVKHLKTGKLRTTYHRFNETG